MEPASSRLKRFFNDQASVRLAQVGYSDPMIRDAKREAWWWLQSRVDVARRRTGLLGGRAVVWTDSGKADLVSVEVPLPAQGEVAVEILSSIVSAGTERAQYLRLPSAVVSYPHRPGYSAAGRVLAVGPGVTRLREGDLVAVRGPSHASVATLPAAAVHPIPPGVPHAAAAHVQLGVICGQGVDKAAIEPGEPVVVVGSGLIGLLAQRIATAAGAGPATVIATSRAKERTARAGGAERVLAAGADADAIAALGAPVVIEATGDPRGIAVAVAAAGEDGRVILLGSPRGVTPDVPVAEVRRRGLRLVGAHVETLTAEGRRTGADLHARQAERFLALLADGALEVQDLAETVVDPREADAFYRALARRRDLVAARFDWTVLPRSARVRRARVARLPDLRARGLDRDNRPLPARLAPARGDDPLATPAGSLRIGLVGCGDIAVHNAAAIAAAPNARLTACFDPVRRLAEDLAAGHGAEVAGSVEALLGRRDVDAVFLAVPHHLHAPLAVQAAEAGKHVIVEKPMANDIAAAHDMAAAAERAGVVLSICFPHRFQPNVVAARRLVRAGALGDPAGTLTTFFADKPASYWLGGFSGRSLSGWRSSRQQAGGGLLIMNLSHLIDVARHVTGLEVETCSAVADVPPGAFEVEDAVSVSIRYANGAAGTLTGSSELRGNRGRPGELHVWGPDGYLTVEPEARLYTARAVEGLTTGRWLALEGLTGGNIRSEYVTRLATAIALGAPPDIGPADGLAVQAFIEAAYRSSDGGEAVALDRLLRAAARVRREAA